MMIDLCNVQRITGSCAVLHEHVHVASGASASAVACADSWLSISTLLIHGRTRVSTAQVAHHDRRCVCKCVMAMYHLVELNEIVCMYDRRCLARFILDAAGVHCYVWTLILHHCERQAVGNGVTI